MVQNACRVSKYDLLTHKGAKGKRRKGKGLRGEGVKLVQTAKAHTKKGEAHFFVLCDWLRVNELCTWPQIRFRFFFAIPVRRERIE